MKPTAHACMPSLERVASRAAPGLTVRLASVLHVHVCVLMRTRVAAKDRQTEWQRGGSARKTCAELRIRMWLKLRLSVSVQSQRRLTTEIKLVLQPECARWMRPFINACTPERARNKDAKEKDA